MLAGVVLMQPQPDERGHEALTDAALLRFTQLHPPSARRTVQSFLADQRSRTYPRLTLDTTPTEPPSALSSLPPPSRPASENNNSRGAAETALVLHHDAEREESSTLKAEKSTGSKAGKRDRDGENDQPPAPKKKPSLVAAMRPRTSSQPLKSPANADAKGSAKAKRTLDRVRESSPVLVPRAPDVANATSAGKVEDEVEVEVQVEKKRKGKEREEPAALEDEDDAPVPVKAKASGARAAKARSVLREKEKENAFESDEEAEHMERLEARRQRRLAKALIVKDRTETAAKKGATAASKLKASKSRSKKEKRKHKDAGSDDDDSDASEDEERESKRRRKVSAAESNTLVQNTKKAANVSGTRLTMKPAVKLGLFHKGSASTRIKIGQKLPDLAFSELNFLNAPRPSPPRSRSSSHSSSSSSSLSTSSHANAKPSRKRAPVPAAVVITYGKKKKKGRHASRYFEEPDQPDQPAPPRAPSPKKSKRKGRAPPPKSSSPPPPPPRKPTKSEKPPVKTKQRRIPSPSPPPPPPPPAISDSGRSAHSLAAAAAEQKRKHASPPPAEREPSETFLDTSGMPWAVPAPRAASLRKPSPAPARNATASPSAVGSGSDSHLDRLIKACLDGHLPGSDSLPNKHQDDLDAPDDDEFSFLSVRDPRPSDLHRWPTDSHLEPEGREPWPQRSGPDHYQHSYRDGDDPRDSRLRDFDVRGSQDDDDDNAGDCAEEELIPFSHQDSHDTTSSLPNFIHDREPRREYGAPSLFGHDDAGESGSWRSDSRKGGGGGESRWSEQREETWPTAGPSTSHFRPANDMDVRPARVPYAFEFDASLSRLHQLGQEGERHTPGADSPAFREAMGSWWHRARP